MNIQKIREKLKEDLKSQRSDLSTFEITSTHFVDTCKGDEEYCHTVQFDYASGCGYVNNIASMTLYILPCEGLSLIADRIDSEVTGIAEAFVDENDCLDQTYYEILLDNSTVCIATELRVDARFQGCGIASVILRNIDALINEISFGTAVAYLGRPCPFLGDVPEDKVEEEKRRLMEFHLHNGLTKVKEEYVWKPIEE